MRKNFISINFKKIIFIFFIYAIFLINIQKYTKFLKICICTLGKQENKYIKEFIEFYKEFGIDKIFIYDNNNIKIQLLILN